jgi:glutamate 5-kinase
MLSSDRIQRIVVKVGSKVLADEDGRLRQARLNALASQVATCMTNRRRVVLVSSGAIACGMGRLGLRRRPTAIAQLQACAAIGQSELMRFYARAFSRYDLTTAQVLLTQDDFAHRPRFQNAKQTLLTLLERRVVPIVNENDTVAVEEITFGDNDRLAALVAGAIDAQLLVLLSDVDGLYKDGAVIERVDALSEDHFQAVKPHQDGSQSKGGMLSKLLAVRMVSKQGIATVIASGHRARVLPDILAGKPVGTLFVPASERLRSHKWWIAFALRQAGGKVVVDAGAAQALLHGGKSLLASGISRVEGRFEPGACVSVVDAAGCELARGLTHYSAADLKRICGKKSSEIADLLGWAVVPEVIHRDRLVLARDLIQQEEV